MKKEIIERTRLRERPASTGAVKRTLEEGDIVSVVAPPEPSPDPAFIFVELTLPGGDPIPGWVLLAHTKDVEGEAPLDFDLGNFVANCITQERVLNDMEATAPWFISGDFLIARALIETGIKSAGQLIPGSDAVGPLQVSSAEWKMFLEKGNPRGLKEIDRSHPISQTAGAAYRMHADAKAISKVKLSKGVGTDKDPFLPSNLDVFHAYLTNSAEAAVAIRDADDAGTKDKKINQVLKGPLTDDQLAALFKARGQFMGTAAAPKSLGEFIAATEAELSDKLKKAFDLIKQHAPDELPQIKQGEAPWFDVALGEEKAEPNPVDEHNLAHKNRIINYFNSTDFHPNKIEAWCGAFAAHCMKNSGNAAAAASVPKDAQRAANWNGWGTKLLVEPGKIPEGAVVVLSPSEGTGSSGHVAFFVRFVDNDQRVELLGGNQSDKLKRSSFAKDKIVHIGWFDTQPSHFRDQFIGGASPTAISKHAFDLIVSFEVSGEAHYEKKLRHTEWPGFSSGVTVGIGYDVGQTPSKTFKEDWTGVISPEMVTALGKASGVTGSAAKRLAAELFNDVDIPFAKAIKVHADRVIPRWVSVVEKALSNTNKLSPDCLGALVSLTFNRGPAGFSSEKDRFTEMRKIKELMVSENFKEIPDQIRRMKRLWPPTSGLQKRRDDEARLFQEGLAPPLVG